MPNKNKKPLGDEEVLTLVEGKVNEGVGWLDSKLSKERERVIQYYNSKLPARQNAGKSSYVSTDVYDSVEAMKSQLLETFAGNPDNLVSFPPQGDEDVNNCRVATEYCSYQIFRLNDGYKICNDVIHDGLTARIGVTKVYWEEKHDDVEEELDGATYEDAQGLAAREDIVEMDAEDVSGDPTNPVFKGTMTRRVDRSQVTILNIPPEEFVVAKSTTCLEEADMQSHRTLKTKAELKKEGYDKKKVDNIHWDDARSLDLTGEKLERDDPISDSTGQDDPLQEELHKVMFYETYVKMDMRDGRGVRLWKICHAGHILLDKQEVERAPFMAFVPLPIPHTLYGNNFAARVIPAQNARTVLTRAILDHASVTTNPRWGVLKGGLVDPKEMLDNRLGGIVNFNRVDAVTPLEQHNLNPFIFQTLEMLKQNKEESTGISSLSQGLNKDAVSNQNSQGLVQDLVTLSQGRQKIIARNFANGWLIPLFLEVYRLVLENEKTEKIVELSGKFERVTPERWEERLDCKVALHLGYGDRDKQTSKLVQTYQMLSADPGLAPMFQAQNRYKLVMDGLKSAMLENASEYLTPPEQAPQPQPDPLKVKELEIKDKSAEASIISAKSGAMKGQKDGEVAALRLELDEMKAHVDTLLKLREADRQDADVANRIDVAQRETAVLEAAPAETVNSIASPNS